MAPLSRSSFTARGLFASVALYRGVCPFSARQLTCAPWGEGAESRVGRDQESLSDPALLAIRVNKTLEWCDCEEGVAAPDEPRSWVQRKTFLNIPQYSGPALYACGLPSPLQ